MHTSLAVPSVVSIQSQSAYKSTYCLTLYSRLVL